ncbi:DUF3142 domain-containing protein [Ectopseudomonas hydrolytica]|uniref:DUF3142 domain-containing protein n=1 Tax=Ectopseudomonas hydrolytica TaxID=2493633 RepID=UPI0018A77BE1|nr:MULTISPECIES: DUF3142 domain-containing protein [Pseudomonas]MBA4245062.1 DUF3142 domain-containing protein [Pseudomonas sp.]MBF8160094.1 DUF3142 domain-containing protein [Pseudomonas mendocina]UTH32133.1 DUF3142 domain-containing protein [Pseudomonas hydrolytica]UZZ11306.1 DUF3142 domain-containing protein [Pseudomonas mendocina]
MGAATQVLLVGLLLLAAGVPAQAARVDAGEHQAFWLWAGVTPQPVLAQARTLYVLQGQIDGPRRAGDPARMLAQNPATPRLSKDVELWVVYRAHTLDWNDEVFALLLSQLQRWQRAGNRVSGVQIDFDAQTLHLSRYAVFLEDLRQRLPRQYRLSITGLLDWAGNADPAALNRLAGVVDEVVMQTYQGRSSIADHQRYLPSIARLQLPFRIGLIQNGEWQAPDYLQSSPWFRGYVVFLLNPSEPATDTPPARP